MIFLILRPFRSLRHAVAFLSDADVSIDAMDSSGESQVNVEHNIFKRKLDLDGKPIEDPEKEHSELDGKLPRT